MQSAGMAQQTFPREKKVDGAPTVQKNGFMSAEKEDDKKQRRVSLTLSNGTGRAGEKSSAHIVAGGRAEFGLEFENAGKLNSVYIRRRKKAPEGAKSQESWKVVYSWNSKRSKQGPASTYVDMQNDGTYEYSLSVQSSRGYAMTKPIEVAFRKDADYTYELPEDRQATPVMISAKIAKQKKRGFLSNFAPGGEIKTVYYSDRMELREEDIAQASQKKPYKVSMESIAAKAELKLDVKDPDWFVESIALRIMRSTTWARGTAQSTDASAVPWNLDNTTTCLVAGARLDVRAFADRYSPFYGYVSADVGYATSTREPGKKKITYNVRADLPVFPARLKNDAMLSARLYGSIGDVTHRTVNDMEGEGVVGAALEIRPRENIFFKPYVAQASMNGVVGTEYENGETKGIFQSNSTIAGIGFGYSTPNGKFSVSINASATIAKGISRNGPEATKNKSASFCITLIP